MSEVSQPNEQLITEIGLFWNMQSGRTSTVRNKRDDINFLLSQLQQTREELTRAKWEDEQFTWLRDQVSVCAKENESLRTELSAKDKVLEQYAYYGDETAINLLSQYRGDTHD